MQTALPQASGQTHAIKKPSPFNRKTAWGLFFALIILLSLGQSGVINKDLVNEGGFEVALRFGRALLHPDLSAGFLALTLQATLTTLSFAVCGAFFSLLIGFVTMMYLDATLG